MKGDPVKLDVVVTCPARFPGRLSPKKLAGNALSVECVALLVYWAVAVQKLGRSQIERVQYVMILKRLKTTTAGIETKPAAIPTSTVRMKVLNFLQSPCSLDPGHPSS